MKRYINSQNIFGMARAGYCGNLEIYVNTDDSGKIPHFHIRDPKDWNRFHSCISIIYPEYFLHGGKQDTLNTKQKKELYDFMVNPVSISRYKDSFENNWQLVCFLWDINNSDVIIPDDVAMPDYRLL